MHDFYHLNYLAVIEFIYQYPLGLVMACAAGRCNNWNDVMNVVDKLRNLKLSLAKARKIR